MKHSARFHFRILCRVIVGFWVVMVLTVPVQAQQPEFRGMWVSRFDGWASSNSDSVTVKISEIMTKLADSHFNAVLFQIRGQADTFYPSPEEPWAPSTSGGWTNFDPTLYAINAAHSRGLEFHAYINTHVCWGGATPPSDLGHLYYRHCKADSPTNRDWLIHDSGGNPVQLVENYVWIAPGVPAAQAYLRRQVMYVVNTYDVDGVHFDRIRTPNYYYSYDPISMARYGGEGNPSSLSFHDWTRDQITRFLRDLYAQVMEVKPNIKVSAAPFGWSSYSTVHQDPAAWFSSGAVDAMVPMIYGSSFSSYLPSWLNMRAGRHLYAGQSIGQVSIQEYLSNINLVRSYGGEGTCIFSYSGFNSGGYWDEISGPGGPYALAAPLPAMGWKTNPTDGIIIGNIMDPDGVTPVVDARITRSGSNDTALSSGDGLYSFLKVPPGNYTLAFNKSGCDPVPPVPCTVTAGEVTRVDVVMGHGAVVTLAAEPTTIRRGGSVHFIPSVSIPTGESIVSYTWDFGNGQVSGSGMPGEVDRTYLEKGTFQASLAVMTARAGPATSDPVQIIVKPTVGDFDGDGDVDMDDFGYLQACLTDVGVPQDDPACADARLDGDADVDQDDLNILLGCFSGPDTPARLDCAD